MYTTNTTALCCNYLYIYLYFLLNYKSLLNYKINILCNFVSYMVPTTVLYTQYILKNTLNNCIIVFYLKLNSTEYN